MKKLLFILFLIPLISGFAVSQDSKSVYHIDLETNEDVSGILFEIPIGDMGKPEISQEGRANCILSSNIEKNILTIGMVCLPPLKTGSGNILKIKFPNPKDFDLVIKNIEVSDPQGNIIDGYSKGGKIKVTGQATNKKTNTNYPELESPKNTVLDKQSENKINNKNNQIINNQNSNQNIQTTNQQTSNTPTSWLMVVGFFLIILVMGGLLVAHHKNNNLAEEKVISAKRTGKSDLNEIDERLSRIDKLLK